MYGETDGQGEGRMRDRQIEGGKDERRTDRETDDDRRTDGWMTDRRTETGRCTETGGQKDGRTDKEMNNNQTIMVNCLLATKSLYTIRRRWAEAFNYVKYKSVCNPSIVSHSQLDESTGC